MTCPLCGTRKARRACPGVGQQICSVCCGTKRLKEIACPADCVYLAASREHPAAVAARRQRDEFSWLVGYMRDLNERQSQLFFLLNSRLARQTGGELQAPNDADVAEAAASIAATLETSARGVIYEHRPQSLPAARLVADLMPVLREAGKGGGTAFERDAAVVLRRIERAGREVTRESERDDRAYLALLRRLIPPDAANPSADAEERPRLILP